LHVKKILSSIIGAIPSSREITVKSSKTFSGINQPDMLVNVSECLANAGRTQCLNTRKQLIPDIQYIKQLSNKYSQNSEQILQTKQDIICYLKNISTNIEEQLSTLTGEEFEDALSRKAVIDYLSENIRYNTDFSMDQSIGFTFGLPTKTIQKTLSGFQEEFDKSVSLFKKERIFDVSDYNLKKYQFDAEEIMKKYEKKAHQRKLYDYRKLFDPIARLKGDWGNDPYINENANFYRIISPQELINLIKTKKTKTLIDSNGYFTNGHYSCITTDPNYSEQAFAANGLPIRIKFKTKTEDGLYNMDLLDRIGCLKEERSIYRVFGYNYDDIDWDSTCIDTGEGWRLYGRDFVDEIEQKL